MDKTMEESGSRLDNHRMDRSKHFFHCHTSLHLSVCWSPPPPSVNLLHIPANLHNPCPNEAYQTQPIAAPHEPNQPLVAPSARCEQLSRNRNPRQASKTDHGIEAGIPPPKHLGTAQLPDAYRGQTDIAAAREAKEQGEDDQLCYTPGAGFGGAGKPDAEDGDQAEGDCDDHGIEASEFVGNVARGPAAEEGAGVQDGEELVGKGGGYAVSKGVG